MRPPARTFPRNPAAAAAGRAWLTGVLERRVPGLQAETRDAVLLALSEALANATRHGRGRSLRVMCWINTTQIRVSVWNTTDQMAAAPSNVHMPDPDAETGRGLPLIHALSKGAWELSIYKRHAHLKFSIPLKTDSTELQDHRGSAFARS